MDRLEDAEKVLKEGLELAITKPLANEEDLKSQIRSEMAQIKRKEGIYVLVMVLVTVLTFSYLNIQEMNRLVHKPLSVQSIKKIPWNSSLESKESFPLKGGMWMCAECACMRQSTS